MAFITSSCPSSISSRSSSSTSSTRALYSKDGQGYDFTTTYPSSSSVSTSPSSTPLLPAQPFKRNLYAKDGRGQGFNFAETYGFDRKQTSTTARPEFRRAVYSKDGQGFNYSKDYAERMH